MIQIRKVQPGIVWVTHPPDFQAGITVAELAALLEVTENTIHRWCRGDPIPRPAKLAMESAVLGLIHCPGWQGVHVSHDRDGMGRLYLDPVKKGFTLAELENWSQVYAHRNALDRELAELRAQLQVRAPTGRVCRFGPTRAPRRTRPPRRLPLPLPERP